MKRFVTFALVALAIALMGYAVLFRANLAVDVNPGEALDVPFAAEDTDLVWEHDGESEHLHLRGVELSSAVPGHHFSEYAATQEDYARWLGQIANMGANAVVVTQLMDDEFYDALLAHNTKHGNPLLLVQGIMAEEDYEESSSNAYASGLMDRLVSQGKVIVDALHGRRDVSAAGIGGNGTYRSDVSPWVVALLVLDEFDVDNVAYTDHSSVHDGTYEGTYFATTADATAFEAMLARVMDEVCAYETTKYDVQRPLGFASSPLTDPLTYADAYARQLGKYVRVDAEHVVSTEACPAGRIAAYRLTNVVDDFATYVSDECTDELAEPLAAARKAAKKDAHLDGYPAFLSAYHTMPLVGFFSSSTARETASSDIEPATEVEQGEALVATAGTLDDAGWAGTIVSSWQDVWARRSWNTVFATYEPNAYLWHDRQTPTQCEGILAFEPGEEAACVLDGAADEWDDGDVVCAADGLTLRAREDAEGLYLQVEGATQDEPVYVALDVSDEVGALACDDPALAFDDDVEFVLCLEGPDATRLLVQTRADATRERFLYELEGTDPFVEIPAADGTDFVVTGIAQRKAGLLPEEEYATEGKTYLERRDTGLLRHGNGDPASDAYDSLADFCYGVDGVEVRLPWVMLNVGDPSTRLVHRDYYDHYGVELRRTKSIRMGIAAKEREGVVELADFGLHGWKHVTCRERLKQSYDVLAAAWDGGA